MARHCGGCGYNRNDDDAFFCSKCGAALGAGPLSPVSGITSLPDGGADIVRATIPSPRQNTIIDAEAWDVDAPAQRSGQVGNLTGPGAIEGTLSRLQRTEEPPIFNIYKTLSRMLIGLMWIVPFVFIFIVSGILSVAFALIGFKTLSSLFNPLAWAVALFELLEVLVIRHLRDAPNMVIAYRGVVQDACGIRHLFLMNGPLRHGSLITGHTVRLEGKWQRGTLIAGQGADLTAGADLQARNGNPWRAIFVIVAILYALAGVLFYAWYPTTITKLPFFNP